MVGTDTRKVADVLNVNKRTLTTRITNKVIIGVAANPTLLRLVLKLYGIYMAKKKLILGMVVDAKNVKK
ncbi:MAG: hypothetical protein QXL94_02950 [Candidatus Parvarchaeum sp.]